MYLRPSSFFDLMSLNVENAMNISIITIGKRYMILNHCNKKGIKLKRITIAKINALNRNAFPFPCLIAIEFTKGGCQLPLQVAGAGVEVPSRQSLRPTTTPYFMCHSERSEESRSFTSFRMTFGLRGPRSASSFTLQ